MSNTYTDLVKQTFYFPQEGFETGMAISFSMGLTSGPSLINMARR